MISGLSSNNLYSAQAAQQASLSRLSSASRINSAKDDAAGAAIASSFTVQLSGGSQAARNIYDGMSLANTAGSGLSKISDNLQRMQELAVQAGNGINSASDNQAIQTELNQLIQNVDQIAGGTQFNGQNLIDGSLNTQLQTGAAAGDTQTVSLWSASSTALGVSGLDVSTPANTANALQSLSSALDNVNAQQAKVGAVESGLESSLSNNSASSVATAESRSRTADADYAQESSNLSQANIRQQVALQALSLYNANQPNPLNFVK